MTLVVLTLFLLFVFLPMLPAGLWLATDGRKTRVRILGVVIAPLGSVPVLLWLLFLYWLSFHSN